MSEVSGPIVAITLVLASVFVPLAFLGGVTGQFYKQFAVTIAAAVIISGFNSLTLSPALAAMLLQPHGAQKGRARALDRAHLRARRSARSTACSGASATATPAASAARSRARRGCSRSTRC